jgi:metallophosphoesterase (TIGR00282 family)
MKILYIGDIMGSMGVEVVSEHLPAIVKSKNVDIVIAQAENVTEGKGISLGDYKKLKKLGIDFFTGGNWSLQREDIILAMDDPDEPIIRPANYPRGTPGLGHKYLNKDGKRVLVISLLGKIVGKDANNPMDNPLKVVDRIIEEQKPYHKDAIIVNFHGDYSSEKVIIGHYLDGYVTAVIGDHWHVPTADARILKKGTAHISDVGMCGALDASLGVTLKSVMPRWRDNIRTANVIESNGRTQFNAVLVSSVKGLAESIEQIQIYT